MNKLIRDGLVAILYSPGYGAGWSTWNQEYPEMVFDSALASLIEEEKYSEAEFYANLKWPDIYTGGLDQIRICWLPAGTEFRINEHDGSETIEVKNKIDWLVA
mgnify:CR=1 FL=1|jgi:hypothetical protein